MLLVMPTPFLRFPYEKLSNPLFRREFLNKLENLIGVLEVIRTKISRQREAHEGNPFQLKRSLHDILRILDICYKSRSNLREWECGIGRPSSMTYREYLELQSFAEYKKMLSFGPVLSSDLAEVDLDLLCRQLAARQSAS